LVDSVTKLMKQIRARSGLKIKYLYANISGQDIVTKHSHAIIPLAERGNKVITHFDIERVNEQARILGSSLEEEIINIVPSGYGIDSKDNIINPLGLYSHKLEADLYLICARLSSVQALSRVINQAGYEMRGILFSGIATARAALTRDSREGVNFFCDIGSDNTEILVFRDGLLKDIEILSVGGDDITRKLQDALRVPFILAEDIKRSYGMVSDPSQIKDEKEILVKKDNFYKPIKQKMVAEIINLSAKELCRQIKEVLDKKAPRHEIKNFVAAGRTLLLDGFIEALENTLSVSVKLARADNPEIPISVKENPDLAAHKYLMYLTSLGMICQVLQEKRGSVISEKQASRNPLTKTLTRFKEVYEEYF
ncbi:MAG: cell division FtsA domain-containing protein, partial [Candidatus Omnitrophota bacterium]